MKIPKPRKRGNSFRIELMFNGKRISATRDTEKECEQWAALKLLELKTGKAEEEKGIKPAYPFKQLCEKYYSDRGSKLKSAAVIKNKFDNIDRILGDLATKSIYDFQPEDIVRWRNKRVLEVQSSTALREFAMFASVFSWAQKELFILDKNVWSVVVKPNKGKPRNQRITPKQQEKLLKGFKWNINTKPIRVMHYVAWSMLFALETAMRKGEILAMRRGHVKDGFIHLPVTKNGDSRNVPLSAEAKRLLALIPQDQDIIVPVKEKSFRRTFYRVRGEVGLDEINFHDTRHEAITRMVKLRKLPVEILAKITGHKTIGILINTYYNPDAQDLVEMFNSTES
ncbi:MULTISPECIES: site-specific integrase [unclassified Acinetobacter]|uniref:integrase n=1 Tax=unclassified Acinetobacter TaxID=196816 RepID=UPI0029351985|nr:MULTISPECIES: site-specific integrase [unclassified Acinetobacter]WOE31946.1 site-specific integrase [Acinetobacter sp. SAAs470]WOE37414.1 site-specific integrase [Acinetobacter sp. SAAs474]